MRGKLVWLIIAALFAIELSAGYSLTLPCESDPYRRCDLDGPNPVRTACGLGYERSC
jgi:hypothetical protein